MVTEEGLVSESFILKNTRIRSIQKFPLYILGELRTLGRTGWRICVIIYTRAPSSIFLFSSFLSSFIFSPRKVRKPGPCTWLAHVQPLSCVSSSQCFILIFSKSLFYFQKPVIIFSFGLLLALLGRATAFSSYVLFSL